MKDVRLLWCGQIHLGGGVDLSTSVGAKELVDVDMLHGRHAVMLDDAGYMF